MTGINVSNANCMGKSHLERTNLRRAVFIDFQGTLGGTGMDDIKSLEFYEFSIPAIKRLNENRMLVIGITNQSHISKGELSWDDYYKKLSLLKAELADQGAHFDAVFCCPHASNDNCKCRKPLTGMIDEACKQFNIDIQNSYVIGDMGMSDMLLAKNIGAKGVLVLTGVGIGSLNEYRNTWKDYNAHYIAANILEAVKHIIEDVIF